MKRAHLIAVMGETAAGKTELAERLADQLEAQLVNADAFQVYRGMDIGTAKSDRKSEYELVDIKNPDETFSVGDFVTRSHVILAGAWEKGRSVVFVGGTGLNIRALFEEFDELHAPAQPDLRAKLTEELERNGLGSLVKQLESLDADAASRVDLANPVRVIRAIEKAVGPKPTKPPKLPEFAKFKFAPRIEPDELERRIEIRVGKMVHNGWALEIERLREQGYRPHDPGFRAIGYRQMWDVVENGKELAEAIAETVVETRQYAKRQRTWLRTEPNLIRLSADSGLETFRQAMKSLVDELN